MQARKSPPHPHDPPRPRQRRLSLAATRRRNRRVHALDDRLIRPDGWWRAWADGRAHGGSAGVDGVGLEAVERGGVQGGLAERAADLQARRYRPTPVRRVYLPTPDGRQRPRGIPTGRDRVVQAACTLVVDPVCEASVRDRAEGCRPKRAAGPAVRAVKAALVGGWWVLDADLQDFVATIDHGRVRRRVPRRVRERRVLHRSRQWLTVGGVEEGRGQATPQGTPPGGVISPWRATIDLHVLERWWEERQAGGGRLYRAADDLVVVCRTPPQAVAAPASSGRLLAWWKLRLHPDTTRWVGRADDGCDCLGCHVHQQPSQRTRRLVPYAWPSGRARRGGRAKIRQQTERCRLRVDRADLVAGLHRVLRGGRNDGRVGNSTKPLAALDRYVRLRLWIFRRTRQGPRGHVRPEGSAVWRRRRGRERFYPPGRGHVPPGMP